MRGAQSHAIRYSIRCKSSNALNKTQLPFTYSSQGPSLVKYTTQHEWIAAHDDGVAFVGITKYAADALGDATYVELPEVDAEIAEGESLGSLESVKSASEIYQPISGKVIGVNNNLEESPQLINQDPLGAGWITKLQLSNAEDVKNSSELLTLEQYEASLELDE